MILQHAGVTQAILKEAVDQKTKKHKQTLADAAEAARIEAQLKRGAVDSDSRRDGSGTGPSGAGGAQRRRGGRRSTLSSRSLAPYQRYKQNEGDEAEEEEGAEEDSEEQEEEEERQGEGENMEGSERPPFGYNSEFYGSGRWSGSSKSRKASASYRKGKAVQPVQAWFDDAGVRPAEDQDDSGGGGGGRARKGLDRRPGQGDWASRLRDGSGGGHSSRQDEDSGCTSTHQDVDTDEESDVGFEFDDEDEEAGKAKQDYKRLRDVCHRAPAARRLYSDPDDLVTSRHHRYQRAHPHPHHEATYPGQHQYRPIDVDATSSSSAEQWEQHRQGQPRTMHDSATTRSRYDIMPHPTSNPHSSTLYQGDYCEPRQGPAAALSSSSGMYLQSESRGTHRADSFRDEGAGQEHRPPSHQHHVQQSQEGTSADERKFYPQTHHHDQQFSAFRYNSPANRPLLPPPYSLQRAVGGGGAPAMMPAAPPPLPEPRSISGIYCDSTQMSVSFSAPARVSSYRRTNNGLTLAPAFPSREAGLNRPLSPSFKTPVKTPVVPSQRLKDATAAQNALNPRSRSPSAAGRQNIAPLAPSPSAPHDSHQPSLSQNELVQVHQPVAGMTHESQIRPPAPTNHGQSQLKQPLQHQSPHMHSIVEPSHVVSLRPSYASAQRDRQATNPFAAAAASNVGMRYQHPSAPAPPQPPLLRPLPSSGSIEHGHQGSAQSDPHEQSHEHVQIPQQPRLPTMKPGHAHRWAYSSPSSTSPIMRPMPCSRLLERSRVPPFIQTEGLRSVPGIEVVKQEEEDEIDITPVEEHLDRGKKRSRDASQENEENETKRAPRVVPQVAEAQGEAQKAEIHQRDEEAEKGNDIKAEGNEEIEPLSKTEKPL
ncbi:hypothetical protein FA10DRAFT_265385 [Acaromyces ingoldii]|uniref:Uncharacterized protein n=1 Tax=Acaromyces ingoldii TaxID=215250 RepID=A0A316YR95_9BASI|nr:hypothetical protein FA10DRAFT_265385 [Acaromyces ingoldii]PWN91536.1 hypothetical protein FA10DRAFT_265385 [Acaromyces ingoldii]